MGPGRRLALLGLLAISVACGAAGCGTAGADRAERARAPTAAADVTLDVELAHGQHWTATGPAVDAAVLCPTGYRRPSAYLDPATRAPIDERKVRSRFQDDPDDRARGRDMIAVMEHTCFDGSGSFLLEEDLGDRTWVVVSGTGAYTGLTGGGTLSVQVTMHAAPESMRLVGEVVPGVGHAT